MTTGLRDRLLHGVGWSLVGKSGTAFFGLLINILVARILSPGDVGVYFLLTTIVGFATLLAVFGFPQVMVRFVAELHKREQFGQMRKVVRQILMTGAGGAVLIMLLYQGAPGDWLSRHFNINATWELNLLVGIWIAFNSSLRLIGEVFRGLNDIRWASLFTSMNFGGVLGGMVLAFFLTVLLPGSGYQLLQIVTLSAASVAVPLVLSIIVLKISFRSVPLVDSGAGADPHREIHYRTLWLTALPLLVTTILHYFLTSGDIWLLGLVGSHADVAVYAVAARLVILTAFPLMVINGFIPPIIAGHFAEGHLIEIEPALRGIAAIAFIPTAAATVLFLLLGEDILDVFFGSFYGSGQHVLLVLMIGQLGNVWAGPCAMVMSMTGLEKSLMFNTVVSGLSMIVLGIAMARSYGPIGLAASVSIINVLRNVAMVLTVQSKRGVWCCATFRRHDVMLAAQQIFGSAERVVDVDEEKAERGKQDKGNG